MLGVVYHYLPILIIRNILLTILLVGIFFIFNEFETSKTTILNIIDKPIEFYNQYLDLLHPYEVLLPTIFILLNFIIVYEIYSDYRCISLPYSLNLTHKIKNLARDNGTISILDKFKSHKDNIITFRNRISIDKKRYEDNIEQIREFLSIPKDYEVILNQISHKRIELYINSISNYLELDISKIITNKIYLGETYNNKDIYLDFSTLTHCLTVGESGSGKSTLLNLFILSLIKNIEQIEKLYLIDYKGVELFRYSKLQKVSFIDKIEDTIKILEDITDIMNQRYDYLKENNLIKYEGNPIFIIIDEVGTIGTYQDKKVKDKIFSLLTNLLQKTRAANIYFFVFSQKIEVSVLPTSITSNIQSKILMKTDNDYNQNQTIGTKEVISKITNLDPSNFPRGRGIFKDGISSDKFVFQTPYFSMDTYLEFV